MPPRQAYPSICSAGFYEWCCINHRLAMWGIPSKVRVQVWWCWHTWCFACPTTLFRLPAHTIHMVSSLKILLITTMAYQYTTIPLRKLLPIHAFPTFYWFWIRSMSQVATMHQLCQRPNDPSVHTVQGFINCLGAVKAVAYIARFPRLRIWNQKAGKTSDNESPTPVRLSVIPMPNQGHAFAQIRILSIVIGSMQNLKVL